MGVLIHHSFTATQQIQGYSKRSIHFQKFILQVLLNIWWHAVYWLKGELSKLFSHFTSTRCELHVWRSRCQIDNQALPTLHITPFGKHNYCVHTWHLVGDSNQNSERFPFHLYTGHGFSISSFCKINFWKCIRLFEYPCIVLKELRCNVQQGEFIVL
jgi:hypothetical protein